MPKPNDLSRSPVALDQDSTLIAIIEMSQSSWLVAAIVPGLKRQPRPEPVGEDRGATLPSEVRIPTQSGH